MPRTLWEPSLPYQDNGTCTGLRACPGPLREPPLPYQDNGTCTGLRACPGPLRSHPCLKRGSTSAEHGRSRREATRVQSTGEATERQHVCKARENKREATRHRLPSSLSVLSSSSSSPSSSSSIIAIISIIIIIIVKLIWLPTRAQQKGTMTVGLARDLLR